MLATLLALSLGAPGIKEKADPAVDIIGEWLIESSTYSGKIKSLADERVTYTFTKDGRRLISRKGVVDQEFEYKVVDAKADPPRVDLISPNSNPAGQAFKAICRIEKDRLLLAQGRLTSAERPTSFESPNGSDVIVWVLKRVKPKD
jgi:uncharacterized protein (TIGR03067 family)